VASYDPIHEAVVFVIFNAFPGSPSARMANGSVVGFNGTGNANIHSKKTPRMEVTSDALLAKIMEIMQSPKYRECRKGMLRCHKLVRDVTKTTKGTIVIRNIFDSHSNCMEVKDVKAVTPYILKKAIQKLENAIKNGRFGNPPKSVACVLFGKNDEWIQKLEPTGRMTIESITAAQCQRLGKTEEELAETHVGCIMCAFLNTKDDLHVSQMGLLSLEGHSV